MRYIVSKQTLNTNIKLAQQMVGKRKLSLIFKEYCEHLVPLLDERPSGELFSIGVEDSVCYALGLANSRNKAAMVNTLASASFLYEHGMKCFYIPIDTGDEREGLLVKDAASLAASIHEYLSPDIVIRGMITNGCINDVHFKRVTEWYDMWGYLVNHFVSLSVGGSYWLDKADQLPFCVEDVRIGRFMLFGYIPFSDKRPGGNCLTVESEVLNVNPRNGKVLLDLGDAYCEPSMCVPHNKDLVLEDVSSNYAVFKSASASSLLRIIVIARPSPS